MNNKSKSNYSYNHNIEDFSDYPVDNNDWPAVNKNRTTTLSDSYLTGAMDETRSWGPSSLHQSVQSHNSSQPITNSNHYDNKSKTIGRSINNSSNYVSNNNDFLESEIVVSRPVSTHKLKNKNISAPSKGKSSGNIKSEDSNNNKAHEEMTATLMEKAKQLESELETYRYHNL